MKAFILLSMIFCHIVDDYYLQGILANMKQRRWWKDNAPDDLYKYDYIVALVMHGFSWAFMIMLPIAVYYILTNTMETDAVVNYSALLIGNAVIHAIVDDLKANKRIINLITDQSLHMVQLIATWICMMFLM